MKTFNEALEIIQEMKAPSYRKALKKQGLGIIGLIKFVLGDENPEAVSLIDDFKKLEKTKLPENEKKKIRSKIYKALIRAKKKADQEKNQVIQKETESLMEKYK